MYTQGNQSSSTLIHSVVNQSNNVTFSTSFQRVNIATSEASVAVINSTNWSLPFTGTPSTKNAIILLHLMISFLAIISTLVILLICLKVIIYCVKMNCNWRLGANTYYLTNNESVMPKETKVKRLFSLNTICGTC